MDMPPIGTCEIGNGYFHKNKSGTIIAQIKKIVGLGLVCVGIMELEEAL
jgi:hypothetical protein